MSKKQISELLTQIGLNPAYRGYLYLVHIIYLVSSDSDFTFFTLKGLYQRTSADLNISSGAIQHNIRTLLDSYWNQENMKYFRNLTGYPVHGPVPPKEFIAVLADYIRRHDN